jgi:hypothetical protein
MSNQVVFAAKIVRGKRTIYTLNPFEAHEIVMIELSPNIERRYAPHGEDVRLYGEGLHPQGASLMRAIAKKCAKVVKN